MTTGKRKIIASRAGYLLVVVSLCLVAGCATERPKASRPAEPTARPPAPTVARRKRPKRRDVALKTGQMAPDFELYTLEHALGKQGEAPAKIRLSSFRGKRPVYLIFASYT